MRLELESIDKEWAYNYDGTRTLWHIHKRFGEWAVKFTRKGGLVLEIGTYWICWTRAHEDDWVEHISRKPSASKQVVADLIVGLAYFRKLVSALKTNGVLR
jgi:hypothetical protein